MLERELIFVGEASLESHANIVCRVIANSFSWREICEPRSR